KEKLDLIRTKFLAESKNIKAPENVIEKKPKKSAPASKKSDDKKAGDKKKSSSKKKSSKSNKDSSKEEKSSKIDPIQSKYMSESFSTNNDPFIFGLSWHSINYKENNSTNIPSVLNRKSVSSNKKNNGGPERE
ncbi:MAG: hypothetical protein J6T74_02135, partial [Clostridia bacterium]|nr:hypothetical protein [Clostridia bacterium]